MKKNFVVLSLLGLMPFLAATEGMPMPGGAAPMPKEEWYYASMTKAKVAFEGYFREVASHGTENKAEDLLDNLAIAIRSILATVPSDINTVDPQTGKKRFSGLANSYCLLVFKASDFALGVPKNEKYFLGLREKPKSPQKLAEERQKMKGAGLKNLYQYKEYLNNIGTFVGKMASSMTNEEGALDKLKIKTKVALRNDGRYYQEYFLEGVEDTEKIDGLPHYFYSEPTKRPAMWRTLLGFGYTDKRGWGRYAFDKLKYPAVAAGLGYAYYRNKEAVDAFGKQAFETGKDYADSGAGFVRHHGGRAAGYVSRHAQPGVDYVSGVAGAAGSKVKAGAGFVGRQARRAGGGIRQKYRDVTGATRRENEENELLEQQRSVRKSTFNKELKHAQKVEAARVKELDRLAKEKAIQEDKIAKIEQKQEEVFSNGNDTGKKMNALLRNPLRKNVVEPAKQFATSVGSNLRSRVNKVAEQGAGIREGVSTNAGNFRQSLRRRMGLSDMGNINQSDIDNFRK